MPLITLPGVGNVLVAFKALIPWEQFPRSILADMLDTRDILVTCYEDATRMSACRATSPYSLPRAYLIGQPAV